MNPSRLVLLARSAEPPGEVASPAVIVDELNRLYRAEGSPAFRLADGAIAGSLSPDADPFAAVVFVTLRSACGYCWRIEWLDGSPSDAAGSGGDRVEIVTGDAGADSLLRDLAPILIDALDGLTDRQKEIAALALIEDLRQSEIAQRLGVRRATVSISFDRAHVASLRRLLRAMRRIATAGVESRRDASI